MMEMCFSTAKNIVKTFRTTGRVFKMKECDTLPDDWLEQQNQLLEEYQKRPQQSPKKRVCLNEERKTSSIQDEEDIDLYPDGGAHDRNLLSRQDSIDSPPNHDQLISNDPLRSFSSFQ
eukprot:TRINITY_DN7675_c0_g1_i3.p1 TRINITY_DN7675_c0_g1~~TRINITY_DN7675_c0_g1_i3.p1  ORF type:complete len:118 (-),score=17.10 TRINITY_DN7675_c0_g1_i3:363-716(-)